MTHRAVCQPSLPVCLGDDFRGGCLSDEFAESISSFKIIANFFRI
jgi:hypothetical protein